MIDKSDKNKKYKIENIYGHIELYDTLRAEGKKLILGGIVKHFSKDGNLEYTTEVDCCSVTFE